MALFTKKRSRWERMAGSTFRLVGSVRRAGSPALKLATSPVAKTAAGVTGAVVAATAASAAASTARRGES